MTPTAEESARSALACVAVRLHTCGWVANHDGNASCRLGEGFLATPTAVSKADISQASLLCLDSEGKVIAGSRKVFSEIALHLACYRANPAVQCVIHAHPPYATALAVAGRSFWDAPFMAEAVVSLGAEIPLLPFMGPGASLEPLESAIARVDAVLLGNHGVLTVGPDLETALLRMELVEHLAKIYLISQSVGGPQPLSLAVVETLLESRAKAGLGVKAASAALPPPPADISALVQDALKRFR